MPAAEQDPLENPASAGFSSSGEPSPAAQRTGSTAAPRPPQPLLERWTRGWRLIVLAVALALAVLVGVRTWVVDVYYVGSASMQPTIEPGDRLLVDQTVEAQELQRGDLVVFDGRGSFAPADEDPPLVDLAQRAGAWLGLRPTEHIFVKRVIGLPGDTVACCAADGSLTVDGQPLPEPYLMPGDAPSETPFEVEVPEGRLWLLGDHRLVSVDSRSLLGAPGGGLVRADRVLGSPVTILWPPHRELEQSPPPQ